MSDARSKATPAERVRLVAGITAAAVLGLLPFVVTRHFAEMFRDLETKLGTIPRLSLAPWFTPAVGAVVLACTILAWGAHKRPHRRAWKGILLAVLIAGFGLYFYGLYAGAVQAASTRR